MFADQAATPDLEEAGIASQWQSINYGEAFFDSIGQNAKYSPRVNVVRFASELGHCTTRSALRWFGAYPSRNPPQVGAPQSGSPALRSAA